VKNSSLRRGSWAAGILSTGIAAFSGGTAHGFGEQAILLKIAMYAIGVASFSFALAVVQARLRWQWRRWFVGALALQLVFYVAWMVWHNDFKYVIAQYAPALLLVLLLETRHAWIWNSSGARAVVVGVLLSFVAAAVQQSGWDLLPHFNHNDLYHCIQMIAMFYLYRGGLSGSIPAAPR
jgi:hypothetical protein